jgi:hypothetical protein
MATKTENASMTNGADGSGRLVELAIRLPSNPGLIINLHLTVLKNSILLLLATSTPDSSNENVAMGSFVYALPDVSLDRSHTSKSMALTAR